MKEDLIIKESKTIIKTTVLYVTALFIAIALISIFFVLLQDSVNDDRKVSKSAVVDTISEREQGVLSITRAFNEQIVSAEDSYGYGLMSERVKRDPRYDTLDEYILWAKEMKVIYPELGTDNVNFSVGVPEEYLIASGEDPSDVLTLVLREEDNVFYIVEVESYYGIKKVGSSIFFPVCNLIFQEQSANDKNCPSWSLPDYSLAAF